MINVYIQSSKQSLNKERNEKPQFLQSKNRRPSNVVEGPSRDIISAFVFVSMSEANTVSKFIDNNKQQAKNMLITFLIFFHIHLYMVFIKSEHYRYLQS